MPLMLEWEIDFWFFLNRQALCFSRIVYVSQSLIGLVNLGASACVVIKPNVMIKWEWLTK